MFKSLSKDYHIIAFCDNSKSKQNRHYSVYRVLSPEELLKTQYDEICVSSQFVDSIYAQLISMKIDPKKIKIATSDQLSRDLEIRFVKKLILISFIYFASIAAIVHDHFSINKAG